MIPDDLSKAKKYVLEEHLGKALETLKPLFERHPSLADADETAQIDDTLRTMFAFMKQNAADPDRSKLYKSLLKRTYRVVADLEISWRCRNVGFYIDQFQHAARINMSHDFIRTVLETFVSDVAMLSLETGDTDQRRMDLYSRHQAFMDRIFAAIATSCQWNNSDREFWSQLLVSPTIDVNDASLLTSAITLSAVNQFDPVKFDILADTYATATDEMVRQRALVGFVMSATHTEEADFFETGKTIERIASLPGAAKELKALQMQMVYCLNADKDQEKIRTEIMPDIMHNADFQFDSTGKLKERKDDPLRDILHPDADEEAMERVEQSMQRMTDMQKHGADIYFGGFQHMKRFSFFNNASNWFLPYYAEQPDVARVRRKLGDSRFIDMLLTHSAFCESDKYSLTLAIDAVFDRLPQSFREMIASGGAVDMAGMQMASDDVSSPAFIRRQYLQDLYRFYRLFPQHGDLTDPFDDSHYAFLTMKQFQSEATSGLFPALAVFFQNQHRTDKMYETLELFDEKQRETLTFNLLYARVCEYIQPDYDKAAECYDKALKIKPDCVDALIGKASLAALRGRYEEAGEAYARLLILDSGNVEYLVKAGEVLSKAGKHDDAGKYLHEAEYRYPDNPQVLRALAMWYMEGKEVDKALKLYRRITDGSMGSVESDDFISLGNALWLKGNTAEAVDAFRHYVDKEGIDKFHENFVRHSRLLAETYGMSHTDIIIMEELIGYEQ